MADSQAQPEMAPAATAGDVATALLRELTPVEQAAAAWYLRRAAGLLLARVPDLPRRVEADPAFRFLVAGIQAEMVARVFRNPEGVTREEQGNYSYQVSYAVATGRLVVMDDEWEQLGAKTVLRSVAGALDGYAAARFDGRPDLRFQSQWPGVPG